MSYPPQQPGYGQQHPGYQQQPGGYGQWPQQPPPKKKSHTGLIIGLIAGAVVLLAGGGVAAFFLLSGDDRVDPRVIAQRYVDAVNNQDGLGVALLGCSLDQSYAEAVTEEVTKQGLKMTLSPEEGSQSEASAGFWVDAERATPEDARDPQERYRLSLSTRGEDSWCITLGALGMPA